MGTNKHATTRDRHTSMPDSAVRLLQSAHGSAGPRRRGLYKLKTQKMQQAKLSIQLSAVSYRRKFVPNSYEVD